MTNNPTRPVPKLTPRVIAGSGPIFEGAREIDCGPTDYETYFPKPKAEGVDADALARAVVKAVAARSMDDYELEALRALAARDCWPIDDLPKGIDLDALRALDAGGWVEVRFWNAHNVGNERYELRPWPGWFSPLTIPTCAGDWPTLLRKTTRDDRNHPPEVRVNEHGRAALQKAEREAKRVTAIDPPAPVTMPGTAPVKANESDFRPATWFPKGMAARLRMAARKSRKTKRVASRKRDGVTFYSVSDARRYWPDDVPKDA